MQEQDAPPPSSQSAPSSEEAQAEATPDAASAPEGEASAPDAGAGDGQETLETLVGIDEARTRLEELTAWMQTQMLTFEAAVQGIILFAALVPAAIFGPQLKKIIQSQIAPRAPYGLLRRGANAFAHVATPIALLIILQSAVIILGSLDMANGLLSASTGLLVAWIVIRLVSLVIRSPFWSRAAFYVAWPIAALNAFGVLDDVVRQLQAFSVPLGKDDAGNVERFSALDFIRTLAVFGMLFWAANFANKFIKGRMSTVDELTVSFKALLSKILDVLLPVVALVAALQIVGFPFGTLAIFGGAVGLGIGLGMQRTVSNFFAGFTLIADKSIKPGDVIEIGDTYGWVTEMNARYVSIRTRDGTAHLVPNDQFINEGVTNWSHSDRVVRLHAPFGVAYSTEDLRGLAKKTEEVALTVERVLKSPAPRCNLMEFGDNSVNFDLRFWINDAANGTANVRSDVLMAVWDMLAEMGVEIPFPQRDLHIKSAPDGIQIGPQSVEVEEIQHVRDQSKSGEQ